MSAIVAPPWTPHPDKVPIGPIAGLPHAVLFLALLVPWTPIHRYIALPLIAGLNLYVIKFLTTNNPAADYGVATFAVTMTMKATDVLWGDYDFRRRGDAAEKEGGGGSGNLLARARWATGLLTNMRGVGWNWEIAQLLPPRKETRLEFLRSRFITLVKMYLTMDLLSIFMQSNPYFASCAAVRPTSLKDVLVIRSSAALAAYLGVATQYVWLSLVGVALNWGEVSDWRDLMGLWCGTRGQGGVGRFWNRFWHQSFRRHFTRVTALFLPSRSPPFLRLLFAFLLSGILHFAGSYALLADPNPLHSGTVIFFLAQPFAIAFERAVLYPVLGRQSPLLWVWTLGWIGWSGGWMEEEMVRGGLWTVPGVPWSVIKWARGSMQ